MYSSYYLEFEIEGGIMMREYESGSRKPWYETIWAQQTLKLRWYYADEFVDHVIFYYNSAFITKVSLIIRVSGPMRVLVNIMCFDIGYYT